MFTCCFLAPGSNNDPDNDDGDAAGDDDVGASHLRNPPRLSPVKHGWQREMGVRATLKLKFTQLPDGRKSLSHITRLGPGAMPHFIRASFQVEW